MHAIEIGGDRYIKATDAAALTGYATDYIGQLSRSKKISAERVGRAWYVSERDILAHKKGTKRSNKQKTQKALKQQIKEHGQIHHVYVDLAQQGFMPEYRKRLLATEVRYEEDTSPLKPAPQKISRSSEISRGESFEKDTEVTDQLPSAETSEQSEDIQDDLEADAKAFDVSEDENSPVAVEIPEEERAVPIEVKMRPERKAKKTEKISHIPLSETAPVPYGKPSYALMVPVKLTALFALVMAFIASVGGVFVEKVLVYQQGETSISRPYYETSYGIRAVSSVIEALPK